MTCTDVLALAVAALTWAACNTNVCTRNSDCSSDGYCSARGVCIIQAVDAAVSFDGGDATTTDAGSVDGSVGDAHPVADAHSVDAASGLSRPSIDRWPLRVDDEVVYDAGRLPPDDVSLIDAGSEIHQDRPHAPFLQRTPD